MERSNRQEDDLDKQITSIRHKSRNEVLWEGYSNSLIQNHPYLVGHAFLVGLGLIISATHMTMFFISFLFLYLISDFMTKDVHKVTRIIPRAVLFSVLYIVIILLITLLIYKAIPLFIRNFSEWSNQIQIQIVKDLKEANTRWNISQFVDIEEVKGAVKRFSTEILRFLVDSLTPLYKGFVQFVFALAVNLLMYFEVDKVERAFTRKPDSLMTFLYSFFQVRIKIFYTYFKRVMGGQILISLINTLISTAVILGLGLPHPLLMVIIVFLCGLFPVIGNLISNSILTINAFVSVGLWGTTVCLFLLIGIHKLEYFLNSQIIGGIVRLPMTISLVALIFCEVLLGISGLILAIPLALFIRHEFEHIPGYRGRWPEEALVAQAEARPNPGSTPPAT